MTGTSINVLNLGYTQMDRIKVVEVGVIVSTQRTTRRSISIGDIVEIKKLYQIALVSIERARILTLVLGPRLEKLKQEGVLKLEVAGKRLDVSSKDVYIELFEIEAIWTKIVVETCTLFNRGKLKKLNLKDQLLARLPEIMRLHLLEVIKSRNEVMCHISEQQGNDRVKYDNKETLVSIHMPDPLTFVKLEKLLELIEEFLLEKAVPYGVAPRGLFNAIAIHVKQPK